MSSINPAITNANDSVDTQVLRSVLVNLVTSPESVILTREIDEQGVLISITVSPQDMGIVIGRNGGMAMAIKTIMRAIGKAHNMSIRIQFLEPDGTNKFPVNKDNQGQPQPSNYENQQQESSPRQSSFEPVAPAPVKVASDLGQQSDDDLKEFILN